VAVQTADTVFSQAGRGYFNGILGMDLLGGRDLTLDYRQGRLCFYDTQGEAPGRETVAIEWVNRRPFTRVRLDGQAPRRVLLDSGSAYTRVTRSMWHALDPMPGILYRTQGFSVIGMETVAYVDLDGFCLQSACPEGLRTQIGGWAAVGGTFFREYLTTFRFGESRLKLTPYASRGHVRPSAIERVGVQIDIEDASAIIWVVEGTPAWRAGIAAGDVIESINGRQAVALGYLGVYDLLYDPDQHLYRFVLRRGDGSGAAVDVTVGG
jgi:hypothetical protein